MSGTAEERIRELEDRVYCLEAIIRHVSEGVILTDQDCRITVFNPAKEKMEQMKAEDVLGKISWEAYSHSNREISEHQQVFDTGVPILNAYRPHAYVGEVPIYIYYSTYPVIRDGKVLGVYTVSRNETLLRELLYETIEHKRSLYRAEEETEEERTLAKGTKFTFENFVGCSPQIKQIIRDAQTIAGLDASILITGETGTGKEVLAQSIHNFGREDKRFVAVNCAAIPDTLMESTMFGSVKGAFTGAVDSQGLLRAAEDGTLFLDEINSMSTAMQAKLLRALQERCVRPVGSMEEYPIRCRLICASNESARELLQGKLMRQDLFYRISDFILAIPPLRERREDILELAKRFICQYNREFHKNITGMSDRLQDWLQAGSWKGNTRELERVMRSLMLRVPEVESELDLQKDIESLLGLEHTAVRPESSYLETTDLQATLRQIQTEIISYRLERNNGNISQTARDLGLQRQNLSQRMKRLELGETPL